jgi:phosphoglycolate phosphatase-like HAD superfamily hydrolase
MIGDSMTDYEAAQATGVPFLLRYTEESKEHFAEINVPEFSSFLELLPSRVSHSVEGAILAR